MEQGEGPLLAVGGVYERYRIEAVLGRGGMAEVYRARHTVLGSMHAIKVLTIPSKKIRQRLIQEGAIQASLQHPNIVTVTDVIEIEGAPALVMEFVDGPSLEARLDRGPLSLDELDRYGRAILTGVAAAHARGLVHRDLKPANVLLMPVTNGFLPKVADFGLAKVMDDPSDPGMTKTGVVMGTPAYMSPEQVTDAKWLDARADVFALGAVLYEMATGRRAFDGSDVSEIMSRVKEARVVSPKQLRQDLPKAFVAVVQAALERDPAKRPADAAAMLAMWDEVGAPEITVPPPPPGVGLTSVYDELAQRRPSVPAPEPVGPPTLDRGGRGVAWWAIPVAGLLGAGLVGVVVIAVKVLTPPPPPPVESPPAPVVLPPEPVATPEPPRPRPKVAPPPTPTPITGPAGTLKLSSRPTAKVKLDGHRAGDTTAFAQLVTEGEHRVVLTDPKGRSITLVARVPDGGEASLCWDFDLQSFCP